MNDKLTVWGKIGLSGAFVAALISYTMVNIFKRLQIIID